MKRIIFTITCIAAAFYVSARQAPDRLIVKSKTEITFPENPNRSADGDGGGPTGMESKSTVYYKGDLIKTYNQSDFGNNTVIIDKKNKRTTTLTEAMGRKTGYYITEEDEIKMKEDAQKRMDSLRAARGESNTQMQNPNNTAREPEIEYTNDTKKIAGLNCKKAIIKNRSRQGEVSETIVWYTPDLKKPADYPAMGNMGGGGGGFARSFRIGRGGGAPNGGGPRGAGGGFGFGGSAGFDKIDGFVMGYSISRPNGFKMQTEVTGIEVNPDINDKVFDIPKGFDVKPFSEMRSQQNSFFIQAGPPGGGQ